MRREVSDWVDDELVSQQADDTIAISRIHDLRLPLLGAVTANDVRSDAMTRASNIAADFKILYNIVQRRKATIQKRLGEEDEVEGEGPPRCLAQHGNRPSPRVPGLPHGKDATATYSHEI